MSPPLVLIIHAHKGHVDPAAFEIERAVAQEFHGELSIGMGLNSGNVVAGNVGGARGASSSL